MTTAAPRCSGPRLTVRRAATGGGGAEMAKGLLIVLSEPVGAADEARPACRTTVSGDVVVRKGGVKRARAAS